MIQVCQTTRTLGLQKIYDVENPSPLIIFKFDHAESSKQAAWRIDALAKDGLLLQGKQELQGSLITFRVNEYNMPPPTSQEIIDQILKILLQVNSPREIIIKKITPNQIKLGKEQ